MTNITRNMLDSLADKSVKRFGKWFVLLFAAWSVLLLSGCETYQDSLSAEAVSYEANYEIISNEKYEMIGDVHPAIFTTVDRNNKDSKRESGAVLGKNGVKFVMNKGRYRISGHPVGNAFIYDENDKLILREIVGDVAGVNSLTVDIDESFSIVLDGGYNYVDVKPVETVLSTELSAGIWDVGLDIEPGDYSITIPYGYGYVQIHEKGKDPLLYELIGGELIRSESEVSLQQGQKIRITKTSLVTFEPLTEK